MLSLDRRGNLGVSLPEGNVLKLKKAIYGLKHAPCAWHKTPDWLLQIGFQRCEAETH
ncbi:hypothetical protein VP01_4275g3 [Puccinia sorghi]|uniref:Reverse transcriptase Ty1/copia-type domain-containing protein n=1 Tax=Puccinia sorghi TaxID=27349 RepID=A0A0L6UR49_9BASI|nr:hypothetical protein VP01_4275g3 [Puccinia sorghi]